MYLHGIFLWQGIFEEYIPGTKTSFFGSILVLGSSPLSTTNPPFLQVH